MVYLLGHGEVFSRENSGFFGGAPGERNNISTEAGLAETKPSEVLAKCVRSKVGIAHRHLDTLVPEYLLQFKDVATLHYPLTGEGMAQVMEYDVGPFATFDGSRWKLGAFKNSMKNFLVNAR